MRKKILVTGAHGFVGKHLCLALERSECYEVMRYGSGDSVEELRGFVSEADGVVHLAGVNRPDDSVDFTRVNGGLTKKLTEFLGDSVKPVFFSSSAQVERGGDYGNSKREGEEHLERYQAVSGAPVANCRLPGIFGKWSRPNYNTVVATFCHNVARGIPCRVDNPDAELSLVYIDDVVKGILDWLDEPGEGLQAPAFGPQYQTTVGGLLEEIEGFRVMRDTYHIPEVGDGLVKKLYSTYLSFLERDDFGREVQMRFDERGWLFELLKTKGAGQMFVSRTKPGITRGNHYHDTKVEKFCVIQGTGIIRFRSVLDDEVIEYPVGDEMIKVVDIPPGLTHNIENTGEGDMITLFWANEVFDPEVPDTYFEGV